MGFQAVRVSVRTVRAHVSYVCVRRTYVVDDLPEADDEDVREDVVENVLDLGAVSVVDVLNDVLETWRF